MSQVANLYSPSVCKSFDHTWCHLAKMLWLVFSPIILAIGTIGNILSICVLLRKRMRQNSASVYLTSLACADIGVLYISLLREWFVQLTEMDYRKANDVTCKLHLWLQFVSFNSSMWLLTAFTVDRHISVVWPIFARTRCSRKIPYVVVTTIPLVLMVIGWHYLLVERRINVQWSNATNTSSIYIVKCSPATDWYMSFAIKIWPIIFTLITSILPASIIFISNIRILKVILSRKIKVAPRNAINAKLRPKRQAEVNRSVNSMLIAVSVFYILSTLPVSLFILLGSSLYKVDTLETVATRELFWAVASLFFYSNSAVNFLLYCFSGSLFRCLFKEMIVSIFQLFRRKITGDNNTRGQDASGMANITIGSTLQTQQSQLDTSQRVSNDSGIIRVPCLPIDRNAPE